jgi:GT2 family glycosyltransferase
MFKLAVLLTCHNRWQQTLECLSALRSAESQSKVTTNIIIVDDGSTDGTTAMVQQRFPAARILSGNGKLYWNGGMRRAFGEALAHKFDVYLWLNDDTILFGEAINMLLSTYTELAAKHGPLQIVVGSTRENKTSNLTYGGLNRRHPVWRPVTFNLVQPGEQPITCDTMNGNCVLIPHAVAERVGNLDEAFVHSMGDTDYGLRARAAGCGVWVMPGFAGTCARNSLTGSFVDAGLPLKERVRKILGPKGMPPKAWWTYTRRHGGLLAPLLWMWPYAKSVLVGAVWRRARNDADLKPHV